MGAARPDTWMPLYWGDYFKDTNHLSTAEHGAYLLLIGHYWSSGKALPDDDTKLAQITRQSMGEWRKMRATLEDFFIVERGKWNHPRVEEELTKAFDFLEKQRVNGLKGGRPPNPTRNPNESQPVTQTKPVGSAKPNPEITTSPSPSPTESLSENHTDPARDASLTLTGYATRAIPTMSERMKALAEKNRRKFQ